MFTKQHYETIAKSINENSYITRTDAQNEIEVIAKDGFIADLCKMFKADNPNFDADKFTKACTG